MMLPKGIVILRRFSDGFAIASSDDWPIPQLVHIQDAILVPYGTRAVTVPWMGQPSWNKSWVGQITDHTQDHHIDLQKLDYGKGHSVTAGYSGSYKVWYVEEEAPDETPAA